MLTNLYIQTTNPKMKFGELFGMKIFTSILLSVVFHTFIYMAFLNLGSFIFFGQFLSNPINFRLFFSFIFILFFGFFARFFHVKEIYRAYHYDIHKTTQHLNTLYIGWIFLS